MIASNHNGSFQRARTDHFIDFQAHGGAFAVPQPADSSRQPLKVHMLLRQRNPSLERCILREQIQRRLVGHGDISRVAGKGNPPEWATALAKKRANVGRHKAGKPIRILYTPLMRHRTDVVAVIKDD